TGTSPSGFSTVLIEIYGQVDGTFNLPSSSISGNFTVTLGSNNGSTAGIIIRADNTNGVTVPDWGFSLDGQVHVGGAVQLNLTNLGVTHTSAAVGTGKGQTTLTGTVAATFPQANITADISVYGLVWSQNDQGNYKLTQFDFAVDIAKTQPSKTFTIGPL